VKFNARFSRSEHYIGPGEFHSSADDIVIATLLGSCISVALYDRSVPVGGLNHFMLPYQRTERVANEEPSSRFGVNAMELLINDILKKGGSKRRLRAKVFGGSTMIVGTEAPVIDVPKMNIDFAFSFLDVERIPIDSYSVGGTAPRRVYFFPTTAKVLMKYSQTTGSAIARRESAYSHLLQERARNDGRPILF
jgi:chemotaxis protein CheD